MFDKPILLSEQVSLFNPILAELRDEKLQADRLRFRFNMERAGELLALELSRHLEYVDTDVTTPLGTCPTPVLQEYPVLVAILRAALALQTGFLRMYDRSDNAFISAYRRHTNKDEFVIEVEYVSAPDLNDRTIVMLDPMIATGRSMVLSYQEILRFGTPKRVFICGVIASDEGVEYVQRHIPKASLILGAIDTEMTARGYIVPGLGDAGDLAYGEKSI